MVERHHQIDFATGALVFPGGQVDPADADAALAPRCTGAASLDERADLVVQLMQFQRLAPGGADMGQTLQ